MAPSAAKTKQIEEQIENVAMCIANLNLFMLSPAYETAFDCEMKLRIEDMATRVQNLRKSAMKAGMGSAVMKTDVIANALDLLAEAARA